MATHSIILPGESHGQRNLEGYSPWSSKESDMAEQLTYTDTSQITVEGVPSCKIRAQALDSD